MLDPAETGIAFVPVRLLALPLRKVTFLSLAFLAIAAAFDVGTPAGW